MALVITIDNAWELKRQFEKANRDYFSYEACDALIELFDELETNTELDPVGLACEFTEESPEYIVDNYDNIDEIAGTKDQDGEIDTDALIDALNYHTWATLLDNGNILYQDF